MQDISRAVQQAKQAGKGIGKGTMLDAISCGMNTSELTLCLSLPSKAYVIFGMPYESSGQQLDTSRDTTVISTI